MFKRNFGNMDFDKLQDIQQDQLNVDKVNSVQPIHDNQPPMMANIPANVQMIPMVNQQSFRPVGPKSMEMTCPSCRCRIKTTVRHRSTAKTHIACLLLTGLCCCCLPYCMDSCRNANHFCPMCETFLGTYSS